MLCLVLLVLCICVLLAAVVVNSRVKDDLSELEKLVRLWQGGWHRGCDESRCDDDGSCINREGTD